MILVHTSQTAVLFVQVSVLGHIHYILDYELAYAAVLITVHNAGFACRPKAEAA